MGIQNIPAGYLPADALLPESVWALPELRYPRILNLTHELLDANIAKGWGDRVAIHSLDDRITYRELLRRVNRLAGGLERLGLGPGDRVLLRLANCQELVVSILALLRIGAVAVPTYPLSRADDIAYRENDTEAAAIILGRELIEEVERAQPRFRHIRHVIVVPEPASQGQTGYRDLMGRGTDECSPAPTDRDDLALIIYTSGTTGEPKGTCHSHRAVLASADSYARYCIRPRPEDVFGTPAPIPFSFGLGYLIIFPLRFGASAVLGAQSSPAAMFQAIERYRVTIFAAVPTFYKMMLAEAAGRNVAIESLRCTLTGGEPLLSSIAAQCQERFRLPLVQFLGTTEMFHIFVTFRLDTDAIREGSFGRAVPGYEVQVRDPDSFEAQPSDTPGLLTARGPTGTRYWRKPDLQREAVRDGWNVVRDIVRMDDQGHLYFISRADEMIISAGYNIAPAEVEELILRHPAVLEAACAGAPDPEGTRSSIVKAFIVLQRGVEPSGGLKSEIQKFVRENGPPYLYPRAVEFVQEIPKTLTGKIRRSALRAR